MRLVRVAGSGTGVVIGDAGSELVVDIATAVARSRRRNHRAIDLLAPYFPPGAASWKPVIADWPLLREPLERLIEQAEEGADFGQRPLYELPLEPPLAEPAVRIFAMGGNFGDHAAAMGEVLDLPESVRVASSPPWGFYVIPGTVVGQGAEITPPPGVQALDYEAEVAVILGGDEHSIGSSDVTIWGYTAWNDFSIRDTALGLSQTDHGPLTWSLTKNFRTGNSCGPVLVVDEAASIDKLRIRCRVNGEIRQDGTTANMKHSFGDIAAHISLYSPLGAGDMLISGTPPGTAMESGADGKFLRNGDEVEVEVDGAGILRNRIEFA